MGNENGSIQPRSGVRQSWATKWVQMQEEREDDGAKTLKRKLSVVDEPRPSSAAVGDSEEAAGISAEAAGDSEECTTHKTCVCLRDFW